MPSKKSPEIDYNGNEVWKYIEKSINPEKIICNGLEKSGHIIDKEQCEGFLKILFNNKENQRITLNIFIRNITYDISDKTFKKRKITTGRQGNPFKISQSDSETIKTFLIGVYVFDKGDNYKKAILVSFPIVEDIKYESNSSLSFPISLIKKTRLSNNPEQWLNSKKRRFIAFKPISFDDKIHYIKYNQTAKIKTVPNSPRFSKIKKLEIDRIFFHETIIGIMITGEEGPFKTGADVKKYFENNTISASNSKLKTVKIDILNYIPSLSDKLPVDTVNDAKKCAKKIIEEMGVGTNIIWTGLNKQTDTYGAADIVASFSQFGTLGISLKKGKGQLKNLGVSSVFRTLGLINITPNYFIERYTQYWDAMTKDWSDFVQKKFESMLKHTLADSKQRDMVSTIFENHNKKTWRQYQEESLSKHELEIFNNVLNTKINKIKWSAFCRKLYEDYDLEWNKKRDKYFDKIFKNFSKEYHSEIETGLIYLFYKQLSICKETNTIYVANGGRTFWFIPSQKDLEIKFGKENFIGKHRTQKGGGGYEFIIDAYNKNKDLVGSIIIVIRFANGQMNGFPTTKSRYKLIKNDWTSILGKISDYY